MLENLERDQGSGQFVPVKEWSCPWHDHDESSHYCDCDLCGFEGCEACARSEWVDKLDESGEVVLRELSVFEVALRKLPPLTRVDVLSAGKVGWLEDEYLPGQA